jgi:hypothetical protein
MFEQIAVWIILAGLLLAVCGYVWLIVRAFRTKLTWGVGVALLLGWIPYLLKFPASAARPSLVVATGLVMAAAPVAYTRILPVDLGPLVRQVEGEKHITLTGWNRSDYSALSAHPDVVVLQMANPDIDDATLEIVARLTNLRELDLTNTKVGDAGLAKLASLNRLRMLKLRGTSASDVAVDGVLAKLPELTMLDARQTQVTAEGAGRWKQSKPGRKIQR